MRILLFILLALAVIPNLYAQAGDPVQAFPDTRIVNAHSGATLNQGILTFRVTHKFGDLIGPRGGWQTFYGLESSTDIALGFEYGITDRLTVGLGRSKGNGPVKRLVEGFAKYKVVQQIEEKWWPTVTIMANTVMSTMKKSLNPENIAHFPKWYHRLSFMSQISIARQFGDNFAFALIPTLLHRNYVSFMDVNDLYFLGIGGNYEFKDGWLIMADVFAPLSTRPGYPKPTYAPLAIAIEYETGAGHIFQVNFSNNEGIVGNDFLPYTGTNWLDKQFRIGFFIVRKFVI